MNSKIVEIIILLFWGSNVSTLQFCTMGRLIESFGNVCGWLPN